MRHLEGSRCEIAPSRGLYKPALISDAYSKTQSAADPNKRAVTPQSSNLECTRKRLPSPLSWFKQNSPKAPSEATRLSRFASIFRSSSPRTQAKYAQQNDISCPSAPPSAQPACTAHAAQNRAASPESTFPESMPPTLPCLAQSRQSIDRQESFCLTPDARCPTYTRDQVSADRVMRLSSIVMRPANTCCGAQSEASWKENSQFAYQSPERRTTSSAEWAKHNRSNISSFIEIPAQPASPDIYMRRLERIGSDDAWNDEDSEFLEAACRRAELKCRLL